MTAYLSNGRGGYTVKKKFRGVPMIRRSIGSRDTDTAARVELMYEALYEQGRVDILEAIAYGRLHPLTALAQWRQGKELTMPAYEVALTLEEAWRVWEDKIPGTDHRASIGTTRRALRIPREATIEALPDLLVKYTERAAKKVRSVNLARAHVRAFLRDTVGVSHALYLRVKDMRPLKRKPRERGTPHPLPAILALVPPMNALLPGAGDMMWTMAVTGMGNKEYWHDGFVSAVGCVSIHGQKRDGRKRDVPRWDDAPLVQPVCWEGKFRDLLREASSGTVAIYDLRRSFARWCEEAGIIESNRDAYLGHGPKTITQLYTFGQLPGQLAGDATLLRTYRAHVLRSVAADARA